MLMNSDNDNSTSMLSTHSRTLGGLSDTGTASDGFAAYEDKYFKTMSNVVVVLETLNTRTSLKVMGSGRFLRNPV